MWRVGWMLGEVGEVGENPYCSTTADKEPRLRQDALGREGRGPEGARGARRAPRARGRHGHSQARRRCQEASAGRRARGGLMGAGATRQDSWRTLEILAWKF